MKNPLSLPLYQAVLLTGLLLFAGCASTGGSYTTKRDKTAKGAGIGAGVGVLAAILDGKTEADEILARAAIGAVVGGGIGAYMDAQEEKLARIPGTTVERIDQNTLLVHFNADVLFAVDSADLSGSSRGALVDMGRVLNEFPKTAVIVQGHTDSTGAEDHNQRLSVRRASSVMTYLKGQGVAAARLAAVGYGETNPVADNNTAAGRKKNRRVDVMLRGKAR